MNALGWCSVCGAPAVGIRAPHARPARLCTVHLATHDVAEALINETAALRRRDGTESKQSAPPGARRPDER